MTQHWSRASWRAVLKKPPSLMGSPDLPPTTKLCVDLHSKALHSYKHHKTITTFHTWIRKGNHQALPSGLHQLDNCDGIKAYFTNLRVFYWMFKSQGKDKQKNTPVIANLSPDFFFDALLCFWKCWHCCHIWPAKRFCHLLEGHISKELLNVCKKHIQDTVADLQRIHRQDIG